MSRVLFIAKLKEGLAGLSQAEIDEIASDYEFHFSEAVASGQSEDDIAARLGDPARLARDLRGDTEQRRSGAPASEPAAAKPSAMGRPGRIWLLWASLLVFSAVIGGYYVAGIRGGGDIKPSSLPSTQARVPESPKRTDVANAGTTALPAPKVLISGGQVLDLGRIEQDKLDVVVDGGGHVSAHGHVKELTLHIDGSGAANFKALQADSVQVELSGTGDAEVTASLAADITISGSGTVRLGAKPKLLKQSVTGSGQVVLPAPGLHK